MDLKIPLTDAGKLTAVALNWEHPRRRTTRKTAAQIEKEKNDLTLEMLRNPLKYEKELEVREIEGKGRGVFATKKYYRHDLICEYKGDLISVAEGKRREREYQKDPNIGSYVYYITRKDIKYCIDATAESPFKGRLLNHSLFCPNCYTKIYEAPDNVFYLAIFAKKVIKPGDELTYNYGDFSESAIENNPWLITS